MIPILEKIKKNFNLKFRLCNRSFTSDNISYVNFYYCMPPASPFAVFGLLDEAIA